MRLREKNRELSQLLSGISLIQNVVDMKIWRLHPKGFFGEKLLSFS
jgi:hypothetical protein